MEKMITSAQVKHLDAVRKFVLREAEKQGFRELHRVELAVEEVFVNIADYAYDQADAKMEVEIVCGTEDGVLVIEFSDQGVPFNPLEECAEPDLLAEERPIGGLGVFLVKECMDEVEYHYESGRNILTLKKKI